MPFSSIRRRVKVSACARLAELLGREVILAADVVGEDAKKKAQALQSGQVLMLENTRFADWKEVVDNIDTDPEAEKVMNNIAEALAFEIVNITNVLYLDRVVLSGAYVYGGSHLAQAINREIKGKSLHQLDGNQVIPGKEVNIVRIAAMPAYYSIFEF